MSSTEIIPRNPLEDAEGLSPEQRHRQLELGHEALRLGEKNDRLLDDAETTPFHKVDRLFANGLKIGANDLARKRNDVARTWHYKANQGAYQEQAVKDAAAADKRTSFGSGQEK